MNYIKRKNIYCAISFLMCGSSVSAQNINGVDSYVDKVISTNVVVTGNDTLKVRNVSVTDKGNLILTSPSCVTIEGDFEILTGGTLIVGRPIKSYRYEYDSNGNRTKVTVIYK